MEPKKLAETMMSSVIKNHPYVSPSIVVELIDEISEVQTIIGLLEIEIEMINNGLYAEIEYENSELRFDELVVIKECIDHIYRHYMRIYGTFRSLGIPEERAKVYDDLSTLVSYSTARVVSARITLSDMNQPTQSDLLELVSKVETTVPQMTKLIGYWSVTPLEQLSIDIPLYLQHINNQISDSDTDLTISDALSKLKELGYD